MQLKEYKKKRQFKFTPEPLGREAKDGNLFVVQEHHARRLHFDFRLQLNGVLKSWAVPKGPSLDPKIKRLAVEVEDHPVEYGSFEGVIPKGQYGAGEVTIWDRGSWYPLGDPNAGLKKGHLAFKLQGAKLKGEWNLIRTRKADKKNQWLLIKKRDILSEPEVLISPQLAVLSKVVPTGKNWIHEIKYDGYRTICVFNKGMVQFFSRSLLDWTNKYRFLIPEVKKIKAEEFVIDGEIVQMDEKGRSDFHLLQEALKRGQTQSLVYYVFDIMKLNGQDLKSLPLAERKEILRKILNKKNLKRILYSDHIGRNGPALYKKACEMGLEGIISKNTEKEYFEGRNDSWLKIKCTRGQEFIIGGYTPPQGQRSGFGALLLGIRDNAGNLIYTGRAGTGFTESDIKELKKKFDSIPRSSSPFKNEVPDSKGATWLEPNLVADVEFRGWTLDKVLRQASFKGLRPDKAPDEIHLEEVEKVILSNPNKILIPKEKITKGEIAKYYEICQERILPHILHRPLSLLRCPNGIKKECFFQKNLTQGFSGHIYNQKIIDPDGGAGQFMYIQSSEGLKGLVQLGTLEIHTWQTHRQNYLYPDQIVFDMDPGPKVSLKEIVNSTLELKDILDSLKLKSFLKVSGGKGFHIHVPIKPIYTWEEVKQFARTLALRMSALNPEKYLAVMTKSKRIGKIFIDYLRNGYGATSIAPYSLRARDSASIALPILWKDISKYEPDEFHIRDVTKNLKKMKDPWKDYFSHTQKISILDDYRAKSK